MIILEKSITVNSTPEKAWNLFLQLNERFSDLHKSHIGFKCIDGNPNQIGSIYKLKKYFRGKIINIKYKLTEFIPQKKLVLFSEFPHVLLGLKATYIIQESEEKTIITEKIQFGFDKPFFARIFNYIIRLALIPNLQYIKSDQEERVKGIKNLLEPEE